MSPFVETGFLYGDGVFCCAEVSCGASLLLEPLISVCHPCW